MMRGGEGWGSGRGWVVRDVAEKGEECDPCIKEETERMCEKRKWTEETDDWMTKGVKEEVKKRADIYTKMHERLE